MRIKEEESVNRKAIGLVFLATGIICGLGFWIGGGNLPQVGWMKKTISVDVEIRTERGNKDDSAQTKLFEEELRKRVAGEKGSYEIFVYNLSQKSGFGINEDKVVGAMSIMKVPIMVAAFARMEEGTIKLDDRYVLQEEDMRDGGGRIDAMVAGTEVKVEEMLEAMGKQSDNTAAAALANLVGREKVEEMVKKLGMDDSSFSENSTTARDVAMMWVNLYRARIVGSESREEMRKYLEDSIYEDRIAAGVPKGIKVFHKVGTGEGIWADAGIVVPNEEGKAPYVVVIMNEGVDLEEAKVTVPDISKMIWEYEQR